LRKSWANKSVEVLIKEFRMELSAFVLDEANAHAHAADLWTRACGEAFALSPHALAYNTRPCFGARQAGQFAMVNDARAGFVLASVLRNDPRAVSPEHGWIDALVVAPEFQKRGIGRALLQWAETWLRAQGCASARLGGSLRTFAPGVPTELASADFFRAHGYAARGKNAETWDLGLDLREYVSPAFLRARDATMRPARESDIAALHAFLEREFPGRWRYEFEQHLRDGARISDYMILLSERGIDACCLITLEDSQRPVERFYPSPLPRPWGQAGSIGVSADRRNAGCGSALLDAALQNLRARGVRGCIIDWTHLVAYYERFGFKPHRSYQMLVKEL
jgi:beta-N-acetylhexosaminidase